MYYLLRGGKCWAARAKRYGTALIAVSKAAFSNGANDVANSYATSVAAQTLSMPIVGVLAFCTEFVGAVALGSRVTKTIKNGIIDIDRFENRPIDAGDELRRGWQRYLALHCHHPRLPGLDDADSRRCFDRCRLRQPG